MNVILNSLYIRNYIRKTQLKLFNSQLKNGNLSDPYNSKVLKSP